IEVLKALVKDPRNEVWLLSGYPRSELARVGREVGGRLGIVAENGCFVRARNLKAKEGKGQGQGQGEGGGGGGEWMSMVANLNMTWKGVCSEMLHYFTERTPGSHVQEREASVVWSFSPPSSSLSTTTTTTSSLSPSSLSTSPSSPSPDADRDSQWARRQAAEAQNHIFDSLGERFGLRIIPSSNSFLVLPNNISWSTAIGSILERGGGGEEWDIVLAMSGDERLLRRLGELDGSETVSIGRGVGARGGTGTDARWSLGKGAEGREGGGDVGRVLREFAEC
ncbi:Trehalose-6-P synthase/phosphatase complex subunit, partial [Marasmius crinis-equi]